MKVKRVGVKSLIFVALALSVSGQGENDSYFALSSSRSFGSGADSKPTISMNGWNVESLDFHLQAEGYLGVRDRPAIREFQRA